MAVMDMIYIFFARFYLQFLFRGQQRVRKQVFASLVVVLVSGELFNW